MRSSTSTGASRWTTPFGLVLLGLVLLCPTSRAQREELPLHMRVRPVQQVSYEAVPLFHDDTSRAYLSIHYRIREDFFIILRNNEDPQTSPFIGRGELAVELLDEKGISVAREIRRIRVYKNAVPQEGDPKIDLQGAISFSAPKGLSTIVFSLEDKQSERRFFDRERKVTLHPADTSSTYISNPMFVQTSLDSGEEETTYEVLNHGSNVFFGERGGLLFSLRLPHEKDSITITYTLTNQTDYAGLDFQKFSGTKFLSSSGLPRLLEGTDSARSSTDPIRYIISPVSAGWRTLFVPLPLERLIHGQLKLELELTAGSIKKSIPLTFRVLWPSRPLSLLNLDVAIEALEHIAKEEEMEPLRSRSTGLSAKAFFAFWKKRDPDTTTAYNELMAEYYRRVDVAIRQYSTLREGEGFKTDQGRIYILYGAPADKQRIFSPSNALREIWTYTNVKKRFIFEDTRKAGTFFLIASEDM